MRLLSLLLLCGSIAVLPAATGDLTGIQSRQSDGTIKAIKITAPGAGTVLRFTGTPSAPFTASALTTADITGLGAYLTTALAIPGPIGGTTPSTGAFTSLSSSEVASFTSVAITGGVSFPDNIRQTFNPGATVDGLNVGSIAGDPTTPTNGGLWYDSTANELTARINGANVALGGGTVTSVGISSPGGITVGASPVTTSGTITLTLDPDLVSIAALTTTAFGRGLLDDADATAARTSLGLGTLATLSAAPASTLSGSTLSTGVTASSLETLGLLSALNVEGTSSFDGVINYFGNQSYGSVTTWTYGGSTAATHRAALGLTATSNTPASASATGNTGEIRWDADYLYVCIASNTWKRVAIGTW